jgi:23S rRNA U2552 (ribose-2'-O)-methylase RlmE/FtsJ
MAPNFTGDAPETHDLTLELNMLSTLLSLQFGTPQCNLIMKSVQGDKEKHLYNFLSTIFTYVHREKPQSSRSESIEFFYVCEKLRIMK